jgi:hypothetical protein
MNMIFNVAGRRNGALAVATVYAPDAAAAIAVMRRMAPPAEWRVEGPAPGPDGRPIQTGRSGLGASMGLGEAVFNR